ncbi:MAG: hypothetical protein JWO04_2904 [Gammaproteobacteria bacterium]|nr:hypothetical protein [Gammaproteobacteria bacterium]
MKRSRAVLIGVLAASVAILGYQRYQEPRQPVALQAPQVVGSEDPAAKASAASNIAGSVAQYPRADRQMTSAMPRTYPRPPSNWLTNEKAFYEKILTAGPFDVLVTPFQVQDWAVDRATRSLMAAELAAAIARTPQTKVADPYLVAKALGEGQRRLVEEDIYRVANVTGVRRIVWGYVGHNRSGKISITIRVQDRLATASNTSSWTTPITTKNFENVAIDAEHPPIEAYESLLPEISTTLGLDPATTTTAKTESTLDVDNLPATPANLVTAQDSPARDAYTFLLFSALTPAYIERTKERFAEKALLALARMSKESPEYPVLRARAYMVIGLRPAAIKVLDTPKADEEKELLAVLNGNLPDVRALASREKNRFKRLLEKLDENNIARSYGVADTAQSLGEVKALNLPGQIWPFLAARAFTDADFWSQFDNATLKLLLDREFPLKEYSLEQIARGAVALSDARANVVHLSVFNHSRKYVEAHASQVCCQSSPDRFDELDYMELLTAAGHDNLIRRLRFLSDIQGTPEPALDFANSIESVYKGYPYYASERAKVERRLAASSGGVEGQGLIRTAFDGRCRQDG